MSCLLLVALAVSSGWVPATEMAHASPSRRATEQPAPPPRLIAFPTYAHPGQTFFLAGGNFPKGQALPISLFCESYYYSAFGRWSWTLPAVNVKPGWFSNWPLRVPTPTFPAYTSPSTVALTPQVLVRAGVSNPSLTMLAGHHMVLSGAGFKPREHVLISATFPLSSPSPINRNDLVKTSVATDASGGFTGAVVNVPLDTTHVIVRLSISGEKSQRISTVTVRVIAACRIYAQVGGEPFAVSTPVFILPANQYPPAPTMKIVVSAGRASNSRSGYQVIDVQTNAPGAQISLLAHYQSIGATVRRVRVAPWTGMASFRWQLPGGAGTGTQFDVAILGKLGAVVARKTVHLVVRA